MLFKYADYKMLNKSIIKIINIMLILFLIFSVFQVSYAENYEWTVNNNVETIETNNTVKNQEGSYSENASNTTEDELNLQSESAILIEQTTRSNIIRKKST